MELSHEAEIGMARKFFDYVVDAAENREDAVYELIDPDNAYGEELCRRLNVDTVREVIALGFKAKYGADWWQKAKPKTQGEWCAHCETPGCDKRRSGKSGKALLFNVTANDMLPPGLENEL